MNDKVVIDCATGREWRENLSAKEIAYLAFIAQEQRASDVAAAQKIAQRDADMATVQAAALTDPQFAALARLVGLGK